MVSYIFREDTNFTLAENPIVIDLSALITGGGRQPIQIICDKKTITVKLEFNEAEGFGDAITLNNDEDLDIGKVIRIELNTISNGSAFRVIGGID